MSDTIKLEIDTTSFQAIEKKYGRGSLLDAVEKGLRRGVNRIWQNLPPYPAAPANSSYRRTGELGRRMYGIVYRKSGGVVGEIGSNRPNAGFVIGPDSGNPHQAWMHVGRWWQLDAQVDDSMGDVVDAIEGEIKEAFGG